MVAQYPQLAPYVRPYVSGGDFIDGVQRRCLWLVDAPPAVLALPPVHARLAAVREVRLASSAASTREFAAYPSLFRQIAQPGSDYLAVPEVSSERRRYIPIAFVPQEVICSNKIQFIATADPYHFGVLTSAMHMAWVRAVCGRLKSDFSYSNTIVYNNFPWPAAPSEAQRQAIESAAQAVLDARAAYPQSSLADLYDPLAMPPALVKAHAALDRAVDAAYVADGGKKTWASDAERVAFLFTRYQQLTSLLPAPAAPARGGKRKAAASKSK
jgi:hypothetical protein